MPTVTCPSCGNAEDLRGRRSPDGVTVECDACGHSWQRDLTPTCTRCGSTDLEPVPTSTLEEAGRGEQRTPSGIRHVYRCDDCGARDATSSSPQVDPDWRRRTADVPRLPRVREDEDRLAPAAPRAADTRRVESAFGRFAPGEVIGGRWRLQRLVRWSSTGSLWLARSVDAERRVLFKLVHPSLTRDRQRTALHAGSAHALVGFDHPHLVPVLDVKVADGQVLVVAAAFDGTVLSRGSRLDPASVIAVAGGLADALAAMHERQVSHLDIRPEKIVRDDAGRARLIDLGSGRVRSAHRTTTASGDRLAFQAPEQILSRAHGPSADVYSLALTVWSLAGGDLQRMGVNAAAQASYRMTNHVPPLDPDATGLPAHVTDAIAAATRRPVDQRPSAAQLASLLRDAGRDG